MTKTSPVYLLAIIPRFFDTRDAVVDDTRKFIATLNRAVPHLKVMTVVLDPSIHQWKREVSRGIRIYSLPSVKIGSLVLPNIRETLSLGIHLSLRKFDFLLTTEDTPTSVILTALLKSFLKTIRVHVVTAREPAHIRMWIARRNNLDRFIRTYLVGKSVKTVVVRSPAIAQWFTKHGIHVELAALPAQLSKQREYVGAARQLFTILHTSSTMTTRPHTTPSWKRSVYA